MEMLQEGKRTAQTRQLGIVSTLERNESGAQSVLDRIGNTPLLRLARVANDHPNVKISAKAEWFNPGGSVKDRPAYSMIKAGLANGELRPGKTILDATSGNTGIAYAMIAAALGYPVKLYLPQSASDERKRILQAYGAELVMTPGDEGTDGAIRRVRELAAAEPGEIFLPRPVQQSGELAGALSRNRKRNLGADGRTHYTLCCGPWNQRNVCGNHAATEGIESEDSVHQLATGWPVERFGRLEAHADSAATRDLRRHTCG